MVFVKGLGIDTSRTGSSSGKKYVGKVKLIIESGSAKAGAPVGPALAQFQLNISGICKEINDMSLASWESGVPVIVRIKINEDRSYEIKIFGPPFYFFFLQFAKKKEF